MACCRERQNQSKANRRLEKKSKELVQQLEEEKTRAEQFKDQVPIEDCTVSPLVTWQNYNEFIKRF